VTADLRRPDVDKRRVLAAAARLLERGLFRVGGEAYAADNGSFGLATVRKEHVRVRQGRVVVFAYPAKSGRRRSVEIDDPALARVIGRLKRRRNGGADLLAYQDDGRWVDVRSEDINAYLRVVLGPGFSAKDFRTWAGTVRAAVALAEGSSGPQAVRRVAEDLGNTPAVARGSYIDPRIVDLAEEGDTVEPDAADLDRAVIDLLEES
jgi:DNA topoisomerase IB